MATTTQVTGAQIVSEAQRWLGVPYLYGGTTMRGVDCSGLVYEVCRALGITACPRTSEEQWAWSTHIPAGEEMTGDLCFIVGSEIDPSPGHVMIVVNSGIPDRVIDAPYTGTVVRYDSYSRNGTGVNKLVGYGRITGVTPSSSASTLLTAEQSQNQSAAEAIGGVIGEGTALVLLAGMVIVAGIIIYIGVKKR